MLFSLTLLIACTPDPDPAPKAPPTEATGDTASMVGETATHTGSTEVTGLAFTTLELRAPDDPNVFLAHQLDASVGEPSTATLWIDDGEVVRRIAFTAEATDHALPVLGLLAGVPHALRLELRTRSGETATAELSLTPQLPPLPLPSTRLVSADPTRVEPGWTLTGLQAPGQADIAAVFDDLGRLRWGRSAVGDVKAAALDEQGVLTYKVGLALTTMDMIGRDRLVYAETDMGPGTILVEPRLFHHDVQRQADGSLFALGKEDLFVEQYPTDYTLTSTGPATITDDVIVRLGPDGALLAEWSSAALLDVQRIGWDSLEPGPAGELDWGHTNAVSYDPADDAVLISLRHQDAVVRFNSDGTVRWILANPDGWNSELAAKRLQPVGAVGWPYHQHAPQWVHDPVHGDLLTLFDNGNNDRTTPYSLSPDPKGNYSRLVQYRIDEEAMTVEEVFSFEVRSGDKAFFAPSMGNADRLPITSNILGTFGTLTAEEDGSNTSNQRGENSTRLIEVAVPSGDVVWDLSIYGDLSTTPKGWRCDQATRVPSLYLGLATETIE